MANFLTKIFGTKQAREIKRISPMVDEVNDIITALHDYGSAETTDPLPITHMVGMSTDEIAAKAAEFEKRWAAQVSGLSPEDPEYAAKLREAENKAAAWFDSSPDEPADFDWRAVYWGIEHQIRAKGKWAGAGDDYILRLLPRDDIDVTKRSVKKGFFARLWDSIKRIFKGKKVLPWEIGFPLLRVIREELEPKEKGAAKAWLDAKAELARRVRPALVARTRAWQNKLAAKIADAEAQARKIDEEQRKEFWHKRVDELLEPLVKEAFSMVREACYLRLGEEWDVRGFATEWDMFPFNVQVVGGIVLHEGKIAEMRTGEGKTLAATMPLYLNALLGRGAHLVTVNDYLAARDKEWMGPIYTYLGLSVGVIQSGMRPDERQPEYACDITYGTNSEFGFDYLRDNMVHSLGHKVQRPHTFAIVDEVDSALVDEARTPLIISGPTQHIDRGYQRYKPGVQKLFNAQQRLSTDRVAEAEKLLAEENEMEAVPLLLMVKRSTPKHKRLLKIMKEGMTRRLVEDYELRRIRDKNLHELDADNFFTYDEHQRAVELNEKGRKLLNPNDPDFFTLPDLSSGVDEIDKSTDLAGKQKLKAKEELYAEYSRKSELLNNHHALLKAYVLFSRDEDYIVGEGKVVIVDPFTGRPQPGRRYSDGLHEALEAKESVRVQEETQTVATITHQNYFRMYAKLAGMTGTAITQANEFWNIYKLEVLEIPTNKPVRRLDYPDIIYKTRNEKYRAVIDGIEHWHKTGRPILVGTTSVEVSETLSRMLRRKGINHNVLNAKHHQKESEIVREGGQLHKVTIATNMAGRGTDIKLPAEVLAIETRCDLTLAATDAEIVKMASTKACQEDFPTGLIIIGTERHESRRIDNQLRGRSGRQGDPGASRFFLSLEDNLLRIFGADRMQQVIDSFAGKEMEPLSNPMVTRAIEQAQKRVEENNYKIRERLLEYDDVMNKQREIIYSLRDEILAGEELDSLCLDIFSWIVDEMVHTRCAGAPQEWDWEGLQMDFISSFLLDFTVPSPDDVTKLKIEDLLDTLNKRAEEAYALRVETMAERFAELQNIVLLTTIDRHWRDHLWTLDEIKRGIGLRSIGQKDPLIEYKKEATEAFSAMVESFRRDVTKLLFKAQLKQAPVRRQAPVRAYQEAAPSGVSAPSSGPSSPSSVPGAAGGVPTNAEVAQRMGKQRPVTVKNKVGRNDPCPCGSGKKYKKCCYPKFG